MRYIGLDLALTTQHKAVVMDEQGRSLSPVLFVETGAQSLVRLFELARAGGAPDEPLVVVMEPTGMVWFPIAVFCQRQGIKVFLVNGQPVADWRRYYRKHAKSDRIDARVLAKLPVVSPEKLHPLQLAEAAHLACQRGCKELDRWSVLMTAIQNRLRAIDRFAWPGWEQVLPDLIGPFTRWFREQWYDPRRVVATGAEGLQRAWAETAPQSAHFPGDWESFRGLVHLAAEVLALYGADSIFLDYAGLQAEVLREQTLLAWVEATHPERQLDTVRPLYRQFHPSRNLETLYGVGPDGAAVYVSFIGDPKRFPGHADFRGWTGMIPRSSQTGVSEAQGMPISQAGPDLVKKFAFMGAETARLRDPQIAAIYYDQVVRHGKHHTQAVCTCATHWLDRIWTVLKEDRPYELRDGDGTPVSAEQARDIIAARYRVAPELRQRHNQCARRERKERLAEKKWKRESAPIQVRGESETPSL